MIEPYLDLFQLSDATVSEIDHEEALSSTIYRIDKKGSLPTILKIYWDSEKFEREHHFLSLLQNKYPVPKVLKTAEEEKHPAILMEFLDGDPIKDLGSKTAFKMGELLGELHNLPVKEKTDPLQEMRSYLFRSLSECQDTVSQEILTQAEFYFEERAECLKEVDTPCIVHRDFKPSNLIAQSGKILGVIDWENACISFAEEDFAQMEVLVWEKDPESKSSFLEGYAKVRKLPFLDPIMPLLRMLKYIGHMGFTIHRGTWQSTQAPLYQANLQKLEGLIF